MSDRTPAQIEADIARTRGELQATVDELSFRLNPRNEASYLMNEAKTALSAVKRKVTRAEQPAFEPVPSRTGWIVLATGAAVTVTLVVVLVRKL